MVMVVLFQVKIQMIQEHKGIQMVILAVILDRLTQSFTTPPSTSLPDRFRGFLDLWRVR